MTSDEALMEFRAWLRVSNYRPASIRFYTTGLPPFWAFLSQSGITDLRQVTRSTLEQICGFCANIAEAGPRLD